MALLQLLKSNNITSYKKYWIKKKIFSIRIFKTINLRIVKLNMNLNKPTNI